MKASNLRKNPLLCVVSMLECTSSKDFGTNDFIFGYPALCKMKPGEWPPPVVQWGNAGITTGLPTIFICSRKINIVGNFLGWPPAMWLHSPAIADKYPWIIPGQTHQNLWGPRRGPTLVECPIPRSFRPRRGRMLRKVRPLRGRNPIHVANFYQRATSPRSKLILMRLPWIFRKSGDFPSF